MEKGNLSINSENILPIIKKWLYSDKDIFLRELVSNASDAITKFKKIVSLGEAESHGDEKYSIVVELDKENKTIKVKDNGIGMTSDEINEFINQIAFSGASAFMEKYKDKLDQTSEIIGHFGLGFYSAFMVAGTVEIDTLSYRHDAQPALWLCDGGIEYQMGEGTRTERGTTITLHIADDSLEFLEEYTLRSVLTKYCSFMPVEIFYNVIKPLPEEHEHPEPDDTDGNDISALDTDAADEDIDALDDATADEDIDDLDDATADEDIDDLDDDDAADADAPKPINDTSPLWLRAVKDCTDEDYKSFYHKVFMDYNDPLFWIHLNMDYPFRLKGILFFPKLKHELETIEGQVKLYNNQVYVADNIKEVIPEFLLLLKGVMDCPDLPLNVSRSFLQNDGYASKMSEYITKKVADKLNQLFKNERESFEKFWDDISPFIKYGCIKEKSFYDKIKDILLFKSSKGGHITADEYLERNKDKNDKKIFYVTDEKQQAQYVKMFNDNDMEAVYLTTNLDTAYISFLEMQNHDKMTFARIDADISQSMRDTDKTEDLSEMKESLAAIFKKALSNDKINIDLQSLKSEKVSGVILLSEQSRRMQDMARMFGDSMMGFGGGMESGETLVLNAGNKLVTRLAELTGDDSKSEQAEMIAAHIYDLALMGHKQLEPEVMTRFIERSNQILTILAEN